MDWTTIIGIIASPICAGIGWLAGRRKRKNDFLNDLQASIDLLAQKNSELLKELVAVRSQNADLMNNQEVMKRQIEMLTLENSELKREVASLNERLSGVRTITREGRKYN